MSTLCPSVCAPGGFSTEQRWKKWSQITYDSENILYSKDSDENEDTTCNKNCDENIDSEDEKIKNNNNWIELPPHKDENQINLDINRSFVYYPVNISEKEHKEKQIFLKKIISHVFRIHPNLCYFQGYHDIAQVILLAFEDSDFTHKINDNMSMSWTTILNSKIEENSKDLRVFSILESITFNFLRDFMLPSFDPVFQHTNLVTSLLELADPQYAKAISAVHPIGYALSPIITLFSHNIKSFSLILEIFDYLINNLISENGGSIHVIYIMVAILLQDKELKDKIITLSSYSKTKNTDSTLKDEIHSYLSHITQNITTHEQICSILNKAKNLYLKYPPKSLKNWKNVDSLSVLKQTKKFDNIKDAEDSFEKQKVKLCQTLRKRENKKVQFSNCKNYFLNNNFNLSFNLSWFSTTIHSTSFKRWLAVLVVVIGMAVAVHDKKEKIQFW